MEEFDSENAIAARLRVAVRAALLASPLVSPELRKALGEEFAQIWDQELAKLDSKYPRLAASCKGWNKQQKEERAIMALVAEVLGPEGMLEGGAVWRTCIRGCAKHPPRPARVLRVFYQVRQDIQDGVKIRTTISKYAWSMYCQFKD